jgi:hypothetical protein
VARRTPDRRRALAGDADAAAGHHVRRSAVVEPPAVETHLLDAPWNRGRVVLIGVTLFVIVPLYALTATYDGNQVNDTRSTAQAGWMEATTGDLAFDERWPEDVVYHRAQPCAVAVPDEGDLA